MLPMRPLAKIAVSTTVAVGADYALETTIEHTTDIDTDSFGCSLGTAVFGGCVAYKLLPVTDRLVDKIADRWQARKDRKKNDEE